MILLIQNLACRFLNFRPLLFIFNRGTGYFEKFFSKKNFDSISIEILNKVISRADTLENFLLNPELQAIYYSALVKYFSSKNMSRQFSLQTYEILLNQIRTLAREVPGFSERAWRSDKAQTSVLVKVREKSTGRKVNSFGWKLKRREWIAKLDLTSNGISKSEVRNILSKVRTTIRDFENELLTKPKAPGVRKQIKIERNAFYTKLMGDRHLKRVAAHFIHSYTIHSQNKIFYELMDADLITHYFTQLRENPKVVIPGWIEAPIPNALLSLVKNMIPSAKELLCDQNVFPASESNSLRGRNSVYSTFSVRPFHGIWTGIFANDCLAGDPHHAHLITPARWAVSILKGTKVEFVERNGRYQGFVRTVPIIHPDAGVLSNLEVWVPVMSRAVRNTHRFSQTLNPELSFFEQWFESWIESKGNNEDNIVVSESRLIDNERVKNAIFASRVYREGEQLAASNRTTIVEKDFMKKVNSSLPPSLEAEAYFSGDAAIDATLTDASTLRRLNTGIQYVESNYLGILKVKNG